MDFGRFSGLTRPLRGSKALASNDTLLGGDDLAVESGELKKRRLYSISEKIEHVALVINLPRMMKVTGIRSGLIGKVRLFGERF